METLWKPPNDKHELSICIVMYPSDINMRTWLSILLPIVPSSSIFLVKWTKTDRMKLEFASSLCGDDLGNSTSNSQSISNISASWHLSRPLGTVPGASGRPGLQTVPAIGHEWQLLWAKDGEFLRSPRLVFKDLLEATKVLAMVKFPKRVQNPYPQEMLGLGKPEIIQIFSVCGSR